MAIVDKHHAMADEHAVADYDAGADETVAGDFAAAADLRRLLDLDEGANAGLVTDLASVEVDERRQPHVLAEFYIISDRNVAGKLATGRHRATRRLGVVVPSRLAAGARAWPPQARSPREGPKVRRSAECVRSVRS